MQQYIMLIILSLDSGDKLPTYVDPCPKYTNVKSSKLHFVPLFQLEKSGLLHWIINTLAFYTLCCILIGCINTNYAFIWVLLSIYQGGRGCVSNVTDRPTGCPGFDSRCWCSSLVVTAPPCHPQRSWESLKRALPIRTLASFMFKIYISITELNWSYPLTINHIHTKHIYIYTYKRNKRFKIWR